MRENEAVESRQSVKERRWKSASDHTHVRRRLRALQLRQWGKRRHIVRHLRELGVRKGPASRMVYSHLSTWALSGHVLVNNAMRNVYFTVRGLVSVADEWLNRTKPSSAPAQLSLNLGMS